ncbi:thiamine-phosphate pyrophosphorylase [Ruminococcus sp. YE71]|uniref:thiamine phosphate synthase n=1 Tax=unclassified Ruminococcus TaxID=2608920 RepID=UPI00088231FD|nr:MULTISPECIES: thiamine phosphate synthase [unclassified Ruminococcus]SDA09729.1 thiamine-phosphate pyrophosphorylase [Ruminococcus sp. YE78]SFW11514.1 thiamine-phosphate pyrophosphorylase [Ruminococcus sp. YE71]
MDKKNVSYKLYVCTDSGLMTSATVEESVEAAVKGGATVIQLREKNATSRELYELAVRVRAVTAKYNVPLIIDDRVDIAIAADADGVHLGQSDLPCAAARKMLGEDKIIGVTAPTPELARAAKADGADYIGIGAMFATSTKTDTKPCTKENLAAVRAAFDLPMVIIGGVKRSNVMQFAGMGIDGAAVISDIIADPDPEAAAREMRTILENF